MDVKVKRLIKDLQNTDDDLRTLSAMTLLKLDYPEAETRQEVLSALVTATQDQNVSVRFFARKAIDKISKDEKMLVSSMEDAHIPIVDRLASHDFKQRLSAVMDIKKKAGEEGVKEEYKSKLIEMLQTEDHPFVVAGLISCLKYFLEKEEASLLSEFLQNNDNRVRSNTIEALEYLKAEEAIPSLFPALSDSDNRIRAVAAKALQSFGEEKVFTVLKKMLDANEEWMKGSAIYALSHIQAGEAIKLLIEAARSSSSADIRTKAIIALANYHDTAAYGFLKGMSINGEEGFKDTAAKAIKLMEDKFGAEPPQTTLMTEEMVQETSASASKAKSEDSGEKEDLATTVTKFFRKGKEEAIGLSNKAAINFALNDLKKELDEHARDAGRTVFDIYQGGELEVPELLSIGHEILRMNYFIQKYTEQEAKSNTKSDAGGFFAQLKSFFSPKTQAEKTNANQAEKFSKRRDDLLLKLGQMALKKFEDKEDEFKPKILEAQFLTYQKLVARYENEHKRLEEGAAAATEN